MYLADNGDQVPRSAALGNPCTDGCRAGHRNARAVGAGGAAAEGQGTSRHAATGPKMPGAGSSLVRHLSRGYINQHFLVYQKNIIGNRIYKKAGQ